MPYSTQRHGNAHPEDVKAEVRKRAGSLAALAREYNVSDSVVRAALIRPQPSGNRVIAQCLELPMHNIWPEWYDKNERRILSK